MKFELGGQHLFQNCCNILENGLSNLLHREGPRLELHRSVCHVSQRTKVHVLEHMKKKVFVKINIG
jgi:hypothetical protein